MKYLAQIRGNLRLPTKTSRGFLLCALCFVLFYALFLSLLYGKDRLESGVLFAREQAAKFGLFMDKPQIELLPPSVSIANLRYRTKSGENIEVRDLHASINVLTSTMDIEAKAFGGTIEATIEASSLFSPEDISLEVDGKNLQIADIMPLANVGQYESLVSIKEGETDVKLSLEAPLNNRKIPQIFAGKGALELILEGVRAEHSLPMLVNPNLEDIRGHAKSAWEKNDILIEEARIENPVFSVSFDGGITANSVQPLDSRLNLRSIVTIPLEELNEQFVPARTLQALKRNDQVLINMAGTLRRPSIDVPL